MGEDEVYNAVKAIYRGYGEFIRDVADEVGWEKTTEIYTKRSREGGSRTAQFMKTHGADTRLSEWARRGLDFYNSSGWKMDAEVSRESVEFIIHRCPCFDGFLEAGLSREEVNRLCKANHVAQDRQLSLDLPGASFTSVVKPSKDEPCIEKLRIPI